MPRPADGADESEEVAWRREVALLERVISHLLAKDNVLVVADTPEVRILLHLALLHCCASVWIRRCGCLARRGGHQRRQAWALANARCRCSRWTRRTRRSPERRSVTVCAEAGGRGAGGVGAAPHCRARAGRQPQLR